MALTETKVVNQALRILGDESIAAYPDVSGTTRGDLINEIYETTRDSTLAAREWPEATKRVKLSAYTEPAGTLTPGATTGTGITFTASVAVFAAGDVGKVLRGDPTATPPRAGKATIVTFTDTTHVVADITEDFASVSAIPTGEWRLYMSPPAFGYNWTIQAPSDRLLLRSVKATDGIEPPMFDPSQFALEEDKILSNYDDIYVRYIFQLTDVTKWGPHLVEAIVAHLVAKMAEPITGQIEKGSFYTKMYEKLLDFPFSARRAVGHTTEDTRAPLVDARYMSDARAAGNPLTQDR